MSKAYSVQIDHGQITLPAEVCEKVGVRVGDWLQVSVKGGQVLMTPAEGAPLADQIGSFRRFGDEGVVYELLEQIDEDRAQVKVVETGEVLSYPVAQLLSDPSA